MKKLPILHLIGLIISLLIFMAACTSGASDTESVGESDDREEEMEIKSFSNEAVTLKVATPWGVDHFMSRIGDHIEEALPHITLEHIDWSGSSGELEDLYANQIVPDVLLAHTGQRPLEELDMIFPLDEMLDEYEIDLTGVNPALLNDIRARDKENRLVGIPAETSGAGLHYNKEIFDLFGVPYPEEAMTWTETFDLAARMTGERDGVYYRGLEMEIVTEPLAQLSVNMTDPETGEVLITTDPAFTKFMDLMEQFYRIPGLYNEDPETRNQEFAQKTVAMHISWHGFLTWFGGEDAQAYQEAIDILPMPYWEDLPNVVPVRGTHPWVINEYSEQKEAALQFLAESLTPEYQIKLSKAGTPPVLLDDDILAQFGADNGVYEGKNILALFQGEQAELPERKSVWDQYVDLEGALTEFAESDIDVPTFLRNLKEESEAKIADAKAQ